MDTTWKTGDRVEGGATPEDHDTGRVVRVDGDLVTVAWSGSNETTTQRGDALRAEGNTGAVDDCTCYGRGQCAACTLAAMDAGEELPDTEAQRSVDAILKK